MQRETFDVLVDGMKKGEAYDVNPIVINSDIECKQCLETLKKTLILSKEELKLLDSCLAVVSAKDGDSVPFGPGEIISLSELAIKHQDKLNEIMACSHHLSESIDCEGDLPPNIFISTAEVYGALSDILAAGLKAGSITQEYSIPLEDQDDDFEEELSDNE